MSLTDQCLTSLKLSEAVHILLAIWCIFLPCILTSWVQSKYVFLIFNMLSLSLLAPLMRQMKLFLQFPIGGKSAVSRGQRSPVLLLSAAVYNVRKLTRTVNCDAFQDAVRPRGRVNGELQLQSERTFPLSSPPDCVLFKQD